MDISEFEASFDTGTKLYKVFMVLRDKQWHCRACEYAHVGSSQLAGGSGIQACSAARTAAPD